LDADSFSSFNVSDSPQLPRKGREGKEVAGIWSPIQILIHLQFRITLQVLPRSEIKQSSDEDEVVIKEITGHKWTGERLAEENQF
jgi:hypothetical protein